MWVVQNAYQQQNNLFYAFHFSSYSMNEKKNYSTMIFLHIHRRPYTIHRLKTLGNIFLFSIRIFSYFSLCPVYFCLNSFAFFLLFFHFTLIYVIQNKKENIEIRSYLISKMQCNAMQCWLCIASTLCNIVICFVYFCLDRFFFNQ